MTPDILAAIAQAEVRFDDCDRHLSEAKRYKKLIERSSDTEGET